MHIFCFINTFRDDFSCMWTCWITVSCCCSCCWCCVCKYAAPLCMIMHGYIHAVYVHTVSCCCSCWCCVCKYSALRPYVRLCMDTYSHTRGICNYCKLLLLLLMLFMQIRCTLMYSTMNYVRVWIHHRITNDRMEKHGKGGWIGHNLRAGPLPPYDFTPIYLFIYNSVGYILVCTVNDVEERENTRTWEGQWQGKDRKSGQKKICIELGQGNEDRQKEENR